MAQHRDRRYGNLDLFLDSVLTVLRSLRRGCLCLGCALLLSAGMVRAEHLSAVQITERLERAHHSGEAGLLGEVAVHLDAALAEARSDGNAPEVAALLRARWLLSLYQNNLQDGYSALAEAIELRRSIGADPGDIVDLERDLAYTHVLMGQLADAIRILRRCVVYRLQTPQLVELERDLYSLGDAYLKNGELDIARRYFEQVREVGSEEPITSEAARLKIGTIHRLQGDLPSALTEHRRTRDYFSQHGFYRVIVADIELARDHLAAGDFEHAASRARTALHDDRILIEQEIDAALVMLSVAMERGDDAEARRWMTRVDEYLRESAERTSSPFSNPLRQLELATRAVNFHAATGDRDAFESAAARGKRIVRYIADYLGGDAATRHAWSGRTRPFTEAYISGLYRLDPAALADVLEELYFIVPDTNLPPAASSKRELVAIDAYLEAERAVIDARAAAERTDDPVTRRAFETAKRERDLARDRYLADRTPLPVAAREAAPLPEHIRVPEGQLYLRYFVQDTVAVVVARDAEGVTVHALPRRSELSHTVSALSDALAPGSAAGKLQQQRLLTEARSLIPWARVSPATTSIVVVTDDLLHSVPFNAISRREDTYEPLHRSIQVLRANSGIEFYQTATATPETNSELFVFADPAFSGHRDPAPVPAPETLRSWMEQLVPLPFTREEAKSIATFYPNRVTVRTGVEATSAELLSETARNAEVLHVATHGYFNEATPDIVGIATAPDGSARSGFLGLTEMLSYPFHNRLIVVSGCETMQGRRFDGLGVRGLPQGLMANGAQAVVGTLWPVPDRPTAMFMRTFYASLKQTDGDVAAALDAARAGMIASRQYASPTYWAGFVYTARNAGSTTVSL